MLQFIPFSLCRRFHHRFYLLLRSAFVLFRVRFIVLHFFFSLFYSILTLVFVFLKSLNNWIICAAIVCIVNLINIVCQRSNSNFKQSNSRPCVLQSNEKMFEIKENKPTAKFKWTIFAKWWNENVVDWNGPKKAIPYLERCVIQMIKIAWRKSFTENVYVFRFICFCLIFLASMKLWVISGDMYCNRYVS